MAEDHQDIAGSGVGMNVGAALVMVAIGLAGAAVGVVAFRRRDLQEA